MEPSKATYEAEKPSREMLESDLNTKVKTLDELVKVGGMSAPQNLK